MWSSSLYCRAGSRAALRRRLGDQQQAEHSSPASCTRRLDEERSLTKVNERGPADGSRITKNPTRDSYQSLQEGFVVTHTGILKALLSYSALCGSEPVSVQWPADARVHVSRTVAAKESDRGGRCVGRTGTAGSRPDAASPDPRVYLRAADLSEARQLRNGALAARRLRPRPRRPPQNPPGDAATQSAASGAAPGRGWAAATAADRARRTRSRVAR